MSLTHLDEKGAARMVDVSEKSSTVRVAVAESYIVMQPQTLAMIVEGRHAKGDVLPWRVLQAFRRPKKPVT